MTIRCPRCNRECDCTNPYAPVHCECGLEWIPEIPPRQPQKFNWDTFPNDAQFRFMAGIAFLLSVGFIGWVVMRGDMAKFCTTPICVLPLAGLIIGGISWVYLSLKKLFK